MRKKASLVGPKGNKKFRKNDLYRMLLALCAGGSNRLDGEEKTIVGRIAETKHAENGLLLLEHHKCVTSTIF